VEVLDVNINEISDLSRLFLFKNSYESYRWDKSVIVNDLTIKDGIDRCTARTIASMVEEKIFQLELSKVPKSLLKQIILNDTASVIHAQSQLQTA
jgi:hypothetical protein